LTNSFELILVFEPLNLVDSEEDDRVAAGIKGKEIRSRAVEILANVLPTAEQGGNTTILPIIFTRRLPNATPSKRSHSGEDCSALVDPRDGVEPGTLDGCGCPVSFAKIGSSRLH
jgi:hypothetical protein